jgi:hypothetical protein
MALHAVNPLDEHPHTERRQDAPALAVCPVCDGQMETVYQRNNQQVIVCRDCHSGLTVPTSAWEIVRIKRQSKWMPKP